MTANPLWNITTSIYDRASRKTASIDPEFDVTSTVYDAASRAIESVNPLGFITTTTYDRANRKTAVTNPEFETTSTVYDAARRVIETIDPLWNITTSIYDRADRKIASIDPESDVTSTVYDLAGRAIESINPLGFITTTTYDRANRATAVTNPEFETTSTVYDAASRVIETIDPLWNITTSIYDRASRKTASIDPELDVTSTVYDAASRAIESINPLGFITTTTYDRANRKTAVTNPEFETTSTVYDAAGRTIEAIDPLLHVTTTVYDHASRKIAVIDALWEITSTVYDAASRAIESINPLGFITTTTYDRANRPTAVTNPEFETTSTVYDMAGRSIEHINALGFITTTVYDHASRAVAVVDPLHEITSTVYDAASRAIEHINPLGFITTTTYDRANRPIMVTNPEFETTTTVYDMAGRAIESIDPLWHITTTTYDRASRKTAATNPDSETTSTVYDAASRVIETIDPLLHITTTIYDRANRPTEVVDPNHHVTTTLYDVAGRAYEKIDALWEITTTVYDAVNRVVAVVDANSHTTLTVYDAASRAIEHVDALGYITTTTYDRANRKTAVTDPLLNITSTVYDAAGRVIETIDPLGYITTTVYDNADRAIEHIDALNEITTTSYDAAGRTTATINPLHQITSYSYDKADRRIAVIDGNENVTSTVYDAAGRAIAVIDADGGYTTTVYDPASRVLAVVNPDNYATSWVYDSAGRKINELDADSGLITWSYDPANNQTGKLDQRGVITTITYDAVNRPIQDAFSDGQVFSYTYDAVGNRTMQAGNVAGAFYSTYTVRNELYTEKAPSGQIATYTYDPAGRRTNLQAFDGGLFTYTWDAASRQTELTNPRNKTTTMLYDPLRRVIERQYQNGAITTHTYDPAGNLTEVLNRDGIGLPVTDLVYTYDNAAHRLTQNETVSGTLTTWTYDKNYQLLNENRTGPTSFNVTYTYDGAGNRLTQNDGTIVTTYDYTPANRLILATAGTDVTTYINDAAGNRTQMIASGVATYYTWDGPGRMVEAEPPAGVTTFTYDADGRRFTKTPPADATTVYLYDQKNLLQETDDTGVLQTEYSITADKEFGDLISEYGDGDETYHQFDAQWATAALLDDGGTTTGQYTYRAFGLPSPTGAARTNLNFGGQRQYYADVETGLSMLGMGNNGRYYDPAVGKFVSEDPIREKAGDYNYYRLTGNDPINKNDPSGHDYRNESWNDAKKKVAEKHGFHWSRYEELENWYESNKYVMKEVAELVPWVDRYYDAQMHGTLAAQQLGKAAEEFKQAAKLRTEARKLEGHKPDAAAALLREAALHDAGGNSAQAMGMKERQLAIDLEGGTPSAQDYARWFGQGAAEGLRNDAALAVLAVKGGLAKAGLPDPDALLDQLKNLGIEDVIGTAKALIADGDKLWGATIDGALRGVADFFDLPKDQDPATELKDIGSVLKGLIHRVLAVVGKWIHVPELPQMIDDIIHGTNENLPKIVVDIALKIIGYDWDSIVSLVTSVMSSLTNGASVGIGFVLGLIGEVKDKGLWGAIKDLVHKAKHWIAGAAKKVESLPSELLHGAIDSLKSAIPGLVAKAVVELALQLAPGTGWVSIIVKVIKWVVEKRDQIKEFVTGFADGFRALVSQAKKLTTAEGRKELSGIVASKVTSEMVAGADVLLAGLVQLIPGAHAFFDEVGAVRDNIKKTAQTPLREMLEAIKKTIKELVGSTSSGQSSPPVIGKDGTSLYWVVEDGGKFEIWRMASEGKKQTDVSPKSKLAAATREFIEASKGKDLKRIAETRQAFEAALEEAISETEGAKHGSVSKTSVAARPDLTTVPPIKNGQFAAWFNALTADELDKVWSDPKLREKVEDRLRYPGGMHEWNMVARAPKFKRWGLTAEQIAEMRTPIPQVKFQNPSGWHGGPGSGTWHGEILDLIDNSNSFAMFKMKLQAWADNRLVGGAAALPSGLRPNGGSDAK